MIIGLGHQKRSGKDTVMRFLSTYLRQKHPRIIIQHRAFAHELKDICHRLYSWAGLMNWQYYEMNPDKINAVLPEIGKTVRQVWIEFGTNVCREVYSETWVQKCLRGCKSDQITIITDVRFMNEVNAIKSVGGVLVKVFRPGLPIPTDIADIQLNDFDGWDHTIVNDGPLDLLNDRVCAFADSVLTDVVRGKL